MTAEPCFKTFVYLEHGMSLLIQFDVKNVASYIHRGIQEHYNRFCNDRAVHNAPKLMSFNGILQNHANMVDHVTDGKKKRPAI